MASGELTSREAAVHAAVDAVLAEALPMFTPPMRVPPACCAGEELATNRLTANRAVARLGRA